MSNSLHATRSQYAKELKNNYSDPAIKDAKLTDIKSKVWKKKLVKMVTKDIRRDKKQRDQIHKNGET